MYLNQSFSVKSNRYLKIKSTKTYQLYNFYIFYKNKKQHATLQILSLLLTLRKNTILISKVNFIEMYLVN